MPGTRAPIRHPLALFFAIVFGTTWLLQLPAILTHHGLLPGPEARYLPLVGLGYFVPTLAALVLSSRAAGGEGLRAFLRPFANVRVPSVFLVLALAHPALILTGAMLLARVLQGPAAGPLFYPPAAPAQLAAMVIIPFTEQLAWRGFAYARLERRLGPLEASLVVGLAWPLFHLQKQSLLTGLHLDVALWTLLLMAAGTLVYTWFHRRTGSMFVAVAANAGIYLDNPTKALPENTTPLAACALGYAVVALALVLLDRSAWRGSVPSTPFAAELPPGAPAAVRGR
jgi:membrane protease YdiL (CAAX protease family)